MSAARAVVITGASTGIGEACALHLQKLGFLVFAGVRRTADGERLEEAAPERLVPLTLDVTDAAGIAAAAEQVAGQVGDAGLAGLVNNAGISVGGVLELIPLEDLRTQLQVNLIGPVAVTQAFLPLLRRATGRIVNIGSIAGRVASPALGPYAMSKSGVRAFSDSLRRELGHFGIRVSLVEPGAVATPIWEKSAKRAGRTFRNAPPEAMERYAPLVGALREAARQSAAGGIPAVEVAQVVQHALTAKKPRAHYLVGRDARQVALADWLLPASAMDWLIRKKLGW
jgi:NAD(P)-dependent dehydrogenase (short-subunit alcohol dehydrogenase family)